MDDTVVIRYQPCLLDRLIDDEPKRTDEPSRSRVISLRSYENGLKRDLEWLLNACAHPPEENGVRCILHDYPNTLSTVINYGIRQIYGQSTFDIKEIEKDIYNAIRHFEPRINPDTLRVHGHLHGTAVELEIDAEYWAQPIPIRKLIKTKMDIETGTAELFF